MELLLNHPIRRIIIYNILLFIIMTIIYIIIEKSYHGSFKYSEEPDNKNINIGDIIYFSLITHTTIGYGDIIPKTGLAKFFVCLHGFIVLVINLALIWVSVKEGIGDKVEEIKGSIQESLSLQV
jgi:hypothetical protein